MPWETGEDRRLTPCPICRARVGRAGLWSLLGAIMCEGCGRDQIREWNRLTVEESEVFLPQKKGKGRTHGRTETTQTTDRSETSGGGRGNGGPETGGSPGDGLPFLW